MGNNASKILNKVKYIIGIDDLEEDYYEEEQNDIEFEEAPQKRFTRNNKVVNIHTNTNITLVVHEPKKLEDATKVIDDLKTRKPVVINFQKLEGDVKKEVFDFLNGGVYSLEGDIQKVAKDIFILAPKGVEIGGNLKEHIKNKGVFPWQK